MTDRWMNYKRTQDGLRTPWLGDMNTYAKLPKLQILVACKTNCKTYINVLFEPSVGYNPPRSFFRRALDDGIQRSKVLFHLGNQTFHNRDQNNIHPALLKDQTKHFTPFLINLTEGVCYKISRIWESRLRENAECDCK